MENYPDQQAPSSLLTAIHAQLAPLVSSDAARIPTATLLADLQAADWRERLAALHLLIEREASLSLADLRALLADEDSSVRAGAVYLLGHLREQASVELVVEALDDPAWLVRENALLALGELGATGVPVPIDRLEQRLDDAQEFVRETAALALRRARHEESAGEKLSFLRSFASLVRQFRPVDISGEAKIDEDELKEHEEIEPVITNLGPARPLHSPRFPSRLSRAQRWLTVVSAAVVVFGLLAAWLLVLPRLWGTQPAQNTPRVLFQATNLGSLYMPAWATAPKYTTTAISCIAIVPVSTPQATITVPPLECSSPVPVAQPSAPVSNPYLSFVDDRGDLYTWSQNSRGPVSTIRLKPGVFAKDSYASWNWLTPGRYVTLYESAPGSHTVQIWDAIQGRQLFTTSPSLPFAMTQDGWLATLTPKHTVQIWNTSFPDQGDSGRQIITTLTSSHFSQLTFLGWLPDASELATVSADGTIQIWQPFAGSGAGLLLQTLHAKRDNVGAVVRWSPDGQRLATITYDHAGSASPIQIWDLLDGHLLQHFTGLGGPGSLITDIAWLDDGRTMLFSSVNEITLRDITSGKTLLDMPRSNLPSLPFILANYLSPDQHWLVLPQAYGVEIVDLYSDKVLHTLLNNKSYYINIALSPDDTHLATVDGNGLVQVWNMQSGQVAWSYQLPANFNGAAAKIMVNINTGQTVIWSNPVGAAWSPDGKMLAVTYHGGGVVVLSMPGR